MSILVITDDNSGFSIEEAKQLNIKVVHMPVIINGETYFENVNIDNETFYKAQEENADIKTSQPIVQDLISLWDESLKTYDEIIYIPMSSGLSSSLATATMLANDYKDKVFVVDNHRISVTLKASVLDALYLVKMGKSAKEIKEILEKENQISSIYIMVDTLKYLKKGGRVTPAGALLGEAFHIKPVLKIEGGKLDAYAKCLGVKKAKSSMISAMDYDFSNKYKDYKKEQIRLYIAYTYNYQEALNFKKEVANHFQIDENSIEINPLSLSIAVHIGPNSLALASSHIVE